MGPNRSEVFKPLLKISGNICPSDFRRAMGKDGLLVGVLTVALIAAVTCGTEQLATNQETAAVESTALSTPHDFSFSVLQGAEILGGTELNLSDVIGKGKPVVVNFWGSGCPPCVREMPEFEKVHNARGDEFTLIGVDVGPAVGMGTREDGDALIQRLGITYPIGVVSHARLVVRYGLTRVPSTIFITGDGLLYKQVGKPVDAGTLNSLVDELVNFSR